MKSLIIIIAWLSATQGIAQISFVKRYGEFSGKAMSLYTDSNGDYVIACQKGNGSDLGQFGVYKINSHGDILDLNHYGDPNLLDKASQIIHTADGGSAVVGTSNLSNQTGNTKSIYLTKANTAGGIEWAKHYGNNGTEQGLTIEQYSTGEYYVGGSRGNPSTTADFYLLKLNHNGDTIWTKTYGGANSDVLYSIKKTADSNLILCGHSGSFSNGLSDIYLIKINPAGDVIWSKHYGGILSELPSKIKQTADGGFIIIGTSSSFGPAVVNTYAIRTNSQGDTLWTRTFGQPNRDSRGRDIIETADGGFAITGEIDFAAYVLKTDANGNVEWRSEFNPPPPSPGPSTSTVGSSLVQNSDGGFTIAGHWFSGSTFQLLLIRTNSAGIVNTPDILPNPEFQLYPNPISRTSIFSFNNPDSQKYTLYLFSASGKLVRTMPNIVSSEISIEKGPLNKGMYFFQLLSESGIRITGKIFVE